MSKDGQIVLPEVKKSLSFDIIVERNNKKVGVEVSFQVTTNSVIERKAAQAPNRKELMNKNGFYVAYVLDGAGNFQRKTAVSTICKNSDCTVAFSNSEFKLLADWIKRVL